MRKRYQRKRRERRKRRKRKRKQSNLEEQIGADFPSLIFGFLMRIKAETRQRTKPNTQQQAQGMAVRE